MKAILVIDIPNDLSLSDLYISGGLWQAGQDGGWAYEFKAEDIKPMPLKYASNDFYIYDRKYLMENLDREINLLKGTKAFEEIMENKNESNINC